MLKIRSKTPYFLILLLALALAWMWFDRPSGTEQRLQLIEKAYADSIASIRSEYDSILLEHDRQALKAFVDAQNAANRMEGEAIYWKGQFQKEKQRNRNFTNQQTDSLLDLIPTGRP